MPQFTQYGTLPASSKPWTTSSSSTSTSPNCDFGRATVIVASAPRHGAARAGREVDVDQLVAVQRVDVPGLPPLAGGEAQAAAAAEPLRLLGGDDLGAEARQLLLEERALARSAGEDHPRHARRTRRPTW